jgi:hypothetical protein
MIGQMTGQMRPAPKNTPADPWEKKWDYGRSREEITETINGLYALSRRGLWRVLLFIICSAATLRLRTLDLFAALPENVREIIGAPPPLALIHTVLAVSCVSALILIAGRGTENSRGSNGWVQFGLSVSFYPLYAAANSLDSFFPVIFATGLLILVIDHFTIWAKAVSAIREEKERLGKMT